MGVHVTGVHLILIGMHLLIAEVDCKCKMLAEVDCPESSRKVYTLDLTIVSPVMLLVRFLLIVVASRSMLA
jgi:hypothetical protein